MARDHVSRKGTVEGPFTYAKTGGTWHRIWWYQGGRRRSEAVPGARALADRRLLKRMQEAEEERVGLRQPERVVAPTLAEVALRAEREFLPHRQQPDSIVRTLTLLARWWEPTLGAKPVDAIKAGDIRAVISGMRTKGRTGATCNRALAALSCVLEAAVEWEHIPANPCRGRGLRSREEEKTPRVLTVDEARRVVASCSPLWRDFFAAAIYTGCRLSDLTKMRWSQVSPDGQTIHVVGKGKRARAIPIFRPLAELLPPRGKPDDLVFPRRSQKTGQVETDGSRIVSPQKALGAALRAAGVERHLSMHDLRHTFASIYMAQNSDLVGLSRLLGHSNVATTARYVHWLGWTGNAAKFDLEG